MSSLDKMNTRLIAKWVCTNSRPLSIVEDEGFRELINFLAPEYEVPTHTTISANISSYYEEEKKKLCDVCMYVYSTSTYVAALGLGPCTMGQFLYRLNL